MARFQIGMVVGSARKGSINQQLADAMAKLASPDFEFRTLKIDDLPLFNQDIENPTPASVERFRSEVGTSDGLLFVTPEYNRSITPLLLNALSWGSRPYGKNSFVGKAGAIAGATHGTTGTAAGQAHLRDLLGVLDVRLIGQPEAYVQFKQGLIGADGSIADEHYRTLLTKKVEAFTDWVAVVAGAKNG